MTRTEASIGLTVPADRSTCVQAGVLAGLAGLAAFLVLHHLWIVPIWFIAPFGALIAAAGGAAVGAAYHELEPGLPGRPWTAITIWLGIVAILGPPIVLAQLSGPIYAMGQGGAGHLLVPASQAIAMFGLGLLGSASLAGAAVGWLAGRSSRAAGATALAGFALAIGPGHNIPFLGGTPAVGRELVILGLVTAVASVILTRLSARTGAGDPRASNRALASATAAGAALHLEDPASPKSPRITGAGERSPTSITRP